MRIFNRQALEPQKPAPPVEPSYLTRTVEEFRARIEWARKNGNDHELINTAFRFMWMAGDASQCRYPGVSNVVKMELEAGKDVLIEYLAPTVFAQGFLHNMEIWRACRDLDGRSGADDQVRLMQGAIERMAALEEIFSQEIPSAAVELATIFLVDVALQQPTQKATEKWNQRMYLIAKQFARRRSGKSLRRAELERIRLGVLVVDSWLAYQVQSDIETVISKV